MMITRDIYPDKKAWDSGKRGPALPMPSKAGGSSHHNNGYFVRGTQEKNLESYTETRTR